MAQAKGVGLRLIRGFKVPKAPRDHKVLGMALALDRQTLP